MIPLKLSLRNFMCYRSNVPPLSFEGMHLACLCGDNGHGKSALLDAMTWALWGEARAKSDDELIHVGEREMEVELEFAAGPNRYRVLRKRERARLRRAGQTSLELHLADGGGFKAITGNSLRETQQKIIEILRMDYQTFINSAFLLQGRADEFTVKPPAERKKVLSDILGLSLYDDLESRAKEVARRSQSETEGLERSIAEMAPEIARKGEYEAQFRQVQDSLLRLEEQAKTQEATLSALQQEKSALDLKRAQVAEIDQRLEQARRELASLRAQVAELEGRIREYEKTIAEGQTIDQVQKALLQMDEQVKAQETNLSAFQQEKSALDLKRAQVAEIDVRIEQAKRELASLRAQVAEVGERIKQYDKVVAEGDAIERGYQQLVEAREANERLNDAQGELLHLNERKSQLERLIEAARGELITQQTVLRGDISRLESKSEVLPLVESELAKAKAQLRDLDGLEEELAKKKQRRDELSQQIVFLRSSNTQLKAEMETLKEKVDLLAEADARCPLCDTELGVEERERIEANYEAEGCAKAEAYRANEEGLEQTTSQHNAIVTYVADLEAKVNRDRVTVQSRVATLEKEISEAKQAISQVAKIREDLAQIEKRIEEGDYAPSEQVTLKGIAVQIAALGYEGQVHQGVRQRLTELGEYEGKHQKLEEARRFLPRERKALDEAQKREGHWQSLVDEETQKRVTLSKELAVLPDVIDKIGSVRRSLDELNGRRAESRQLLGAMQMRLKEATRLLPRERKALDEAQERISYWQSVFDQEGQKRETLSAELAALPEVIDKITSVQRSLDGLRSGLADNRQLLGAVQQKLADRVRLERIKEEKTTALVKAAAEKGIYDELAVAFGKRGIQALIIEAALPEIEEEANRLLARMTDNRMHLKLETQRETRKGETVETLDIRISDELGTRNYEMFSGGEAFRINFALRIALSHLLARRAGAPLPTLIMDEGFGTQDRAGMEKLIEAINSIQDDFERIIVITHIEELKDAFPVRINVTKTEEGSMIEVN